MPERDQSNVDAMIIDKINTLERNLERRLDEQDRQLRDIKTQTQLTNGRVTTLERARERGMGVIAAYRWIPVVIGGALSAGLALLGTALAGGIH